VYVRPDALKPQAVHLLVIQCRNRADLISICVWPGCTCPASANLVTPTGHYLYLTFLEEKKKVYKAINRERVS